MFEKMAPTKKHTIFVARKLRASDLVGSPNNLPADLVGLALEEEALPGSSQTAHTTQPGWEFGASASPKTCLFLVGNFLSCHLEKNMTRPRERGNISHRFTGRKRNIMDSKMPKGRGICDRSQEGSQVKWDGVFFPLFFGMKRFSHCLKAPMKL